MKRINVSEEVMNGIQDRADAKVKADAKDLMEQLAKDIEIPEGDHNDPLHLVGIGTDLNGNAEFVFDSAEELI